MKNNLFKNENKGVVELYFTTSELVILLELLGFTRRLCESFLLQKDGVLSEEKKEMLKLKSLDASLLEEKIKLDADPGRPDGFLN